MIRSISISLVTLWLIGVSACALIIPKDKYFEYESSSVDVTSGRWLIGIITHRIQVINGRSNYAVTQAHGVVFNYFSSNNKFDYVEINEVVMVSALTGDTVLENVSLNMKSPVGSSVFAGTGIHELNLPFHDYNVSFDYLVYNHSGDVQDSGHVEVTLIRDYYEGYARRGDRL